MIKDCSGWRHHPNPSLDETNSNFKQGEKLGFQNRLVPHPKTLRLNFLVIQKPWQLTTVVEFNLVNCLVQYQCLGILVCDSFAETSYFSMSLNYTFNWFSVFLFRGSTAGYELEGREDRYESMYAGKTDHENPYGTNVVHYESLKVSILKLAQAHHPHSTSWRAIMGPILALDLI